MSLISYLDIYLWADGTWCYREVSHEYGHMSDDFEVLYADTQRWCHFLSAETANI